MDSNRWVEGRREGPGDEDRIGEVEDDWKCGDGRGSKGEDRVGGVASDWK